MIVEPRYFVWFVTVLVLGTAVFWTIVDSVRLRRALTRRGPEARDQVFGSIIGLIIAVLGFVGVYLYHFR